MAPDIASAVALRAMADKPLIRATRCRFPPHLPLSRNRPTRDNRTRLKRLMQNKHQALKSPTAMYHPGLTIISLTIAASANARLSVRLFGFSVCAPRLATPRGVCLASALPMKFCFGSKSRVLAPQNVLVPKVGCRGSWKRQLQGIASPPVAAATAA